MKNEHGVRSIPLWIHSKSSFYQWRVKSKNFKTHRKLLHNIIIYSCGAMPALIEKYLEAETVAKTYQEL